MNMNVNSRKLFAAANGSRGLKRMSEENLESLHKTIRRLRTSKAREATNLVYI